MKQSIRKIHELPDGQSAPASTIQCHHSSCFILLYLHRVSKYQVKVVVKVNLQAQI